MLTSCFGLGRLPLAPGTWGSLPPVIAFYLMGIYGVSQALITNIMAAMVLAGGFACVQFAPAAIAATRKKDPGEVVADEFAGQALVFVFSPFLTMGQATPRQVLLIAFTGFILFRLFDISKPWPLRMLEKYPAGWGILADDLAAGVYAWIILQICIRFLFTY
jgi:phosphatidylglycerophosphatase A